MTIPRSIQKLPEDIRGKLHTAMLIVSHWDGDLFVHSEQVARELLSFAPEGQEEEWYWAGLLHDIGKVGLAHEILYKRGALSRKEKRIVQQHALKGAAILRQIGAPQTLVHGAQFHHERWDGTGYPRQIPGRQIPSVARVLAVVDVYTALTSDRPYRQAFTLEQARLEIERNAGSQFDPEIVARFFERQKDDSR